MCGPPTLLRFRKFVEVGMETSAGELDEAFASHVSAIHGHLSKLGSRHEKIRIQKWLAALSEPMKQMVWKKNRDMHRMCLFPCVCV